MEKILLYKYYRWKNEKLGLREKMKTISYKTWILLMGGLFSFVLFLVLCFKGIHNDMLYLPLILEAIFMGMMNHCFIADRSQKSGVDFDRYKIFCREVKLWLEANDISTRHQINQLSSRYKELENKKRKPLHFSVNISRQWLLFLLIPVSFSMVLHFVELPEVTMSILKDFSLLLILYTALYLIVLGSYELITYLFTTGRNTAQDFVQALNGVLVFCFDDEFDDQNM